MPLEISDAQKEILNTPYKTHFWGQECTCEPVLIDAVLGDGMMLLSFTPLNTRPNYYLIRIDSSWLHCDDGLYDYLDDIYEAIEDQVGPAKFEGDDGEEEQAEWPALDDENGSCWAEQSLKHLLSMERP
jgi:hypothetical protein